MVPTRGLPVHQRGDILSLEDRGARMGELRKSRPNYDGIAWLAAFWVLIGAERYGLPVWSFPMIAAALAIPVAMVKERRVGTLRFSSKPISVYLLEIMVAAVVSGAFAGVFFLAKLVLGFGGPTERQGRARFIGSVSCVCHFEPRDTVGGERTTWNREVVVE